MLEMVADEHQLMIQSMILVFPKIIPLWIHQVNMLVWIYSMMHQQGMTFFNLL